MNRKRKDKVFVIMMRDGKQVGRFKAYLAWHDRRRGRLFDGREVERVTNDSWVYIVR
jgi:hypothetical protein